MKIKLKRILSVIMIFSLCVSLLPITMEQVDATGSVVISNVTINEINYSSVVFSFSTTGKKSKAVVVDVATNEVWNSDWYYESNVTMQFQRRYLSSNPGQVRILIYSYLEAEIASNLCETVQIVSNGTDQLVTFPALGFRNYVDVFPSIIAPDQANIMSGWAATAPSNPLTSIELVINQSQTHYCEMTYREDIDQLFWGIVM